MEGQDWQVGRSAVSRSKLINIITNEKSSHVHFTQEGEMHVGTVLVLWRFVGEPLALSCPGPQLYWKKEHHLLRKHQNSCKRGSTQSGTEALGWFISSAYQRPTQASDSKCVFPTYYLGLSWITALPFSVGLLHRACASMKCIIFCTRDCA